MFSEVLSIIAQVLGATWWLLIFLLVFPVFRSTWLHYRQELFRAAQEWTLLEIHIPREIRKGPKAMEQVLGAIHQLRNSPGTLKETYWDGEVTRSFSLEVVSFGGQVHFYIRTFSKFKDLVEAAIFAYYPDIELEEVEDYAKLFPENYEKMATQGLDLWGTELVLRKDSAYPIRSYKEFEAPDEEHQYDPISAILEVLSKVKKEEVVGIQMLIAPADPKWAEEGQKVVDKLRDKKPGGGGPPKAKNKIDFSTGILPVIETVVPEKKDEAKALTRTPGETDTLKAIEENLRKPAFETLIRLLYLAPKASFFDTLAKKGVLSAFNQYGSNDLNSFAENSAAATKIGSWGLLFPNIRTAYTKQRMLLNYRQRQTPIGPLMGKIITSHIFNTNFFSQRSVLSSESLATIFHPPTFLVLTAPHLRRVESRRAGPPAGLAIFGEESHIEKFQ